MDALFKAEAPGILAWAVRGCLAWQEEGLRVPDEVMEATSEYRREMDTLQEFLEDICMEAPGEKITKKDLYQEYTTWCKAHGEEPLSQKFFSMKMKERGYAETTSTHGIRHWKDIALKLNDGETDAMNDYQQLLQ